MISKLHTNSSLGNDRKRSVPECENAVVKTAALMIASIGITRGNKIVSILAGLTFHLALSFHLACAHLRFTRTSMTVLATFKDSMDLVLWWNLFMKRKELCTMIAALTKERNRLEVAMVIGFTAASFILAPSTVSFCRLVYLRLYQSDTNRLTYGFLCKLFEKMCRLDTKARIVYVVLDTLIFYSTEGTFFITFYLYILSLALISRRSVDVNKLLLTYVHASDPSKAWRACQDQVSRIRTTEKLLSFPVFAVFIRIILQVFTSVIFHAEKADEKFSDGRLSAISLVVQFALWFVLVVLAADLVQERCHTNIDLLFFTSRICCKDSRKSLDYFDYKQLKKRNMLTGWSIMKLNRSFLFTGIASAVTYGIIVAQLREKV